MTPERWQQIREVLEEALDLAPGERSAFLDRACPSDPSLRQEVETLLASSPDVRSSFLQSAPQRITLTSGTKLETQKRTDIGPGSIGSIEHWMLSPDDKYLYFTTSGTEPQAMRLRLADQQVEFITSLKDFHRAVRNGQTEINVAPDGSPIFTRDTGYQEIYALNVRWP